MKKGFLLVFLGFAIGFSSHYTYLNATGYSSKKVDIHNIGGFERKVKPYNKNGDRVENRKVMKKHNQNKKEVNIAKSDFYGGVQPRAAMRAMNHQVM
jgi:hypothetical protein